MERTTHGKIFVGRITGVPPEKVVGSLARLKDLAEGGSSTALRRELEDLIPEARLTSPPSAGALPKAATATDERAAVLVPFRRT